MAKKKFGRKAHKGVFRGKKKIGRKCKWCGVKHSKSVHRSHGVGSFKRTHPKGGKRSKAKRRGKSVMSRGTKYSSARR